MTNECLICESSGFIKATSLNLQKAVEWSGARGLYRLSVGIANIRSRAVGHSHKFRVTEKFFELADDDNTFEFSDWLRGAHIYRHGIDYRTSEIANAYCLGALPFPHISRVLDIGANYGDFTQAVRALMPSASIVAVEPIPWDAVNLEKRFEGVEIIPAAVSDTSGGKTFWLSETGGDSSLIKPSASSAGQIQVEGITLSDIIDLHGKFDLVKVEAEGGEPEILLGAKNKLRLIRYVVVDGGAERGELNLSTETACREVLEQQGFVFMARSPSREGTVLYRNIAMS